MNKKINFPKIIKNINNIKNQCDNVLSNADSEEKEKKLKELKSILKCLAESNLNHKISAFNVKNVIKLYLLIFSLHDILLDPNLKFQISLRFLKAFRIYVIQFRPLILNKLQKIGQILRGFIELITPLFLHNVLVLNTNYSSNGIKVKAAIIKLLYNYLK